MADFSFVRLKPDPSKNIPEFTRMILAAHDYEENQKIFHVAVTLCFYNRSK